MNINAIVQQNYLKGRLAALVRKDPGGQSAFEEKLAAFREKNVMDRLTIAKDPKPDKLEEEDGTRDLYCSKLFSAWDSNLSADQALDKLDLNLTQIGEYTLDSKLDPREVLEHIAAQYTVYKRHIEQTGGKAQLERLDEMTEQHTRKFADAFSQAVGGFYEENGISGERERIYNSVLESVQGWAKAYESYISKNRSSFDKLLRDAQQNQKSLSNELRKAVRKNGVEEVGCKLDNYTSTTLSSAARLAKFSENWLHIGTAEIKNEEELGFELGKVALRARTFMRGLKATPGHEQAFLLSVQKKFDQHLDKVDALLQDKAAIYREQNPTATENPFAPLDRDAVFAVVKAMTVEYDRSVSLSAALETGKAYGLQRYLSKVDSKSETERYRDSAFWQSVVKKTLSSGDAANKQYQFIISQMVEKGNMWLNRFA